MVQHRAVRDAQHIPGRNAHIVNSIFILRSRGVFGLDHGDCHVVKLHRSAQIHADGFGRALAREILQDEQDAWRACLRIMAFIHGAFRYQAQVTNAHTTMVEALELRQGVCQDFANVMIGLCRGLHIPARYVSGYLYNGPADQLRGAQASHAWVEVFLPGLGWLALDPTNAQTAGERHVKLAVGRDYADVSPFKGTYRGTGRRTLTVEVLVTASENSVLAPG